MNSLHVAIYASIVIHFLRMTAGKLLRPAPKLAMPPATPGDTPERVTLAAMVRTGDEWAAFMVSGAVTSTISSSQVNWLHHSMFTASDGLIRELPGTNCEVRLCAWPPDRKNTHITAPIIARMFGLAGYREARFIAMFDSLVHQFNEAVCR